VREYTDGIDNDLQVVNEKLGQMEATQIFNNTRLAGLDATVGRMDNHLTALMRRFDGLNMRMNNQHRRRNQEEGDGMENSGADYGADTEVEDQDQRRPRHNHRGTGGHHPREVHAEDGMVGSFEVRDLELDVLGTVVVPRFPEGDWQDH
jgi:hypothetical protein